MCLLVEIRCRSGISAIATSSPYFGSNAECHERIEQIQHPFQMYSVNVDHGTDESTIDEPFHAEDVPLIEPRRFSVTAWSAIETLRIEKSV
ncbi:MAG: hypothetical protein EZS28_026754 [Streblomastix strix]|uniref:Uncharacterized protein n=1 Tax=Streblomastix strix TaxID=222440 RepID=A0A5J4V6F4_9EUKA|nr:MAG: hypothetical protein EZS28_026754 [Streblomastix strix]